MKITTQGIMFITSTAFIVMMQVLSHLSGMFLLKGNKPFKRQKVFLIQKNLILRYYQWIIKSLNIIFPLEKHIKLLTPLRKHFLLLKQVTSKYITKSVEEAAHHSSTEKNILLWINTVLCFVCKFCYRNTYLNKNVDVRLQFCFLI